MIVVSALLYIGSVYLLYKNFGYFTLAQKGVDCSGNAKFIWISAVVMIIALVMTILPIAENKSIITSGAVSLYIAYMTWSSLTNSVPQ